MLFESVHESVVAYNKKAQQLETDQDRQVFRWKFIVIGLGIVLIVLIGVMSEIYKQISSRYLPEYDTTFMLDLYKQSEFFQSAASMKYFMKGFNTSDFIIYDKASLLYRSNQLVPKDLVTKIENKNNLLYFFSVTGENQYLNGNITSTKFGMYLERPYEDNDQDNRDREIAVSQSRANKISSVFSLESDFSTRLNFTDDCTLYRYKPSTGNFSLIDSFLTSQQNPSAFSIKIQNTYCLGKSSGQTQQNLQSLTTLILNPQEEGRLMLNKVQVFQLKMQNQQLSL